MVPGLRYGSASLRMSIPVQSKKKSAAIVTIAVVLAIAGWSNKGNLTSVLNITIALWRTWYVLLEFQEKRSSRSCKTPHNHHRFHHHDRFCPHSCRRKKLTLIAPLNKDECPGEKNLSLSLSLTNMTSGRGTGISGSPGPILETSTGPLYSLLGAKLCPTSP